MDKYAKHLKRPSNDSVCKNAVDDAAGTENAPKTSAYARTAIENFYLPTDSCETVVTRQSWPTPAAPQKMTTPNNSMIQLTGTNVTRRLEFDDQKTAKDNVNDVVMLEKNQNVNVRSNIVNNDNRDSLHVIVSSIAFNNNLTLKTLNELQQKITENMMTLMTPCSTQINGNNRFRSIIESLLTRGLIVENHCCLQFDLGEGINKNRLKSTTYDQKIVHDLVCNGKFKCLSLFDGQIYNVKVSVEKDSSLQLARVLAALGEHPHIVSYYSNWFDTHYHYIQTELCQANLASSARDEYLKNAADYKIVLEHIASALHYLHNFKKYSHNYVNSNTIFYTITNGGVIYKLGEFQGATQLLDNVSCMTTTASDVTSLCSTVLLLIGANNGDIENISKDKELHSLYNYLLFITSAVDSATTYSADIGDFNAMMSSVTIPTNALDIWRWCCSARQH